MSDEFLWLGVGLQIAAVPITYGLVYHLCKVTERHFDSPGARGIDSIVGNIEGCKDTARLTAIIEAVEAVPIPEGDKYGVDYKAHALRRLGNQLSELQPTQALP